MGSMRLINQRVSLRQFMWERLLILIRVLKRIWRILPLAPHSDDAHSELPRHSSLQLSDKLLTFNLHFKLPLSTLSHQISLPDIRQFLCLDGSRLPQPFLKIPPRSLLFALLISHQEFGKGTDKFWPKVSFPYFFFLLLSELDFSLLPSPPEVVLDRGKLIFEELARLLGTNLPTFLFNSMSEPSL